MESEDVIEDDFDLKTIGLYRMGNIEQGKGFHSAVHSCTHNERRASQCQLNYPLKSLS